MGLPHSEIRGSQLGYQLLSAYRRFQRPSSPLDTKASIMCPFRLGHANPTPCLIPRGFNRWWCTPRWTCIIQRSRAHESLVLTDSNVILECSRCLLVRLMNRTRESESRTLVHLRPVTLGRTRDHRLHLSKIHHFGKRWIGDDRQTHGTVKGVDQAPLAESCTFYYWTVESISPSSHPGDALCPPGTARSTGHST